MTMPDDTARRLDERVDAIRRGAAMQGLREPGDIPTLLAYIDVLTAERDWFLRRLRYTAHSESHGEELPDVERIEQTYAAVMLAMYGKQFSTPNNSPEGTPDA